jgi:hypothetical protein
VIQFGIEKFTCAKIPKIWRKTSVHSTSSICKKFTMSGNYEFISLKIQWSNVTFFGAWQSFTGDCLALSSTMITVLMIWSRDVISQRTLTTQYSQPQPTITYNSSTVLVNSFVLKNVLSNNWIFNQQISKEVTISLLCCYIWNSSIRNTKVRGSWV